MSIRITGMNSGLDTDSMVKELVNAYEKQGEKYTKAKTKTEWKQEAWSNLNTKIKNFFTKYASTMRFSEVYKKKATTVSDSSKATIIADENAINGTQTLKVTSLATAGYLTSGKLEGASKDTKISDLLGEGSDISGGTTITLTKGSEVYSFDINEDTTLGDLAKSVNQVEGITANFDESTGRFFVSSDETGEDNNFTFGGDADVISSLKLTKESGGSKIDGHDAEIVLNGATFNSSTNTFSINGLTITAKAETAANETLSIVTDSDVDAVYNSIKSFISEYSKLVNELDKLYNAESAKDYEPLSDDEKEAMSDDEIEKWETKIKDSLLRRDSDLDNLASAMRGSMLKTYKVGADENGDGGITLSLSSFGIETLGYFDAADNEKNAFHIDGNADDEYTSSKTDRLRAMIASDPSAVEGFFTQLIGGLYESMNKIQTTSNNYTSYGSFYNDKKLSSDLTTQEKKISDYESYVADIEEKYYKQFSSMETTLGNLNSQQSYLSQLFS